MWKAPLADIPQRGQFRSIPHMNNFRILKQSHFALLQLASDSDNSILHYHLIEGLFIRFPDLDELRGYFRKIEL